MKKIAHKLKHPLHGKVEYETPAENKMLDARGEGVVPEGLVADQGPTAVQATQRTGSFAGGSITHVKVYVLQARNLVQADRFGLSDPYVQLELGGQQVKTRVVFDTCQPYWNQEFVLNLPSDDRTLKATVWDYDRPPSKPDFLGAVHLDLHRLLATAETAGTALQSEPEWYALDNKHQTQLLQGELRFAVRLLHAGEVAGHEAAPPVRDYTQYDLDAKVIGTRGLVSSFNTGIHKGITALVQVGSFQTKTSRTMTGSPDESDGLELFWDEDFQVNMDTALAHAERTSLVHSISHHFAGEQSYDHLKKQAAMEEVRFTLKRYRGRRSATGKTSDIVGTAVFPLSAIPEVTPPPDDDDTASVVTMDDNPTTATKGQEDTPAAPGTPQQSENSIINTVKDVAKDAATSLSQVSMTNVIQPIASLLHRKARDADGGMLDGSAHGGIPHGGTVTTANEDGSTATVTHVETDGTSAAAGMEASFARKQEVVQAPVVNTQFWLPLDRAGKGTAGELLVSLSFKKKDLGAAVELDDNEAGEDAEGPDPVPYTPPEALEHALVDEGITVSTTRLFQILFGAKSTFPEEFCKARKCWDVDIEARKSQGSAQVRQITYTMPLKKNSMGPSEAACIEDYKLEHKAAGGWLVTVTASTPKVPYGSSFHNSVQFACWHKAHGQCQLRISGQVVFTKSVFVRGIISKASLEGMQETYRTFMIVLRDQLGNAAPPPPTTLAAAQQAHVEEAVKAHVAPRLAPAWVQPAMLGLLALLLLTMLITLRHVNRAIMRQNDMLREVLQGHTALRETHAALRDTIAQMRAERAALPRLE